MALKGSVILATLAVTLAGGPRMTAQEQPGTPMELLARSSEALLLTVANPSASLPIVIDRARRMDITVTALTQDLDVTFISPKRARYSVGQNRTGFESWVTVLEGIGANYRAIFTQPPPGSWTLVVGGKSLSKDIHVIVNVLMDSEIFVALVGGEADERVGSVAAFTLAAFDGPNRLRGVAVSATVTTPEGKALPLGFVDDGAGLDLDANDGMYTALLELPLEGEYHVDTTVRGNSGGEFLRKTSAAVRAIRPTASFTGTFVDDVVDDDNDGLFDGITIAPAINVLQNGRYNVIVRLRSEDDIVDGNAFFDLAPGVNSPVVRLRAEELRMAFKKDGPYTVDMLLLEREEAHDRVFVDRRLDVGLTGAHRLQDLQHQRTQITQLVSAGGFDTNQNGLFDQYRATFEVNVELGGSYICYGSLRDGEHFYGAHAYPTFAVGLNRCTAVIDGGEIGKNGVDGAFEIKLDVNGPTSSAAAHAYFTTAPLIAAQFEGGTPDTTPPSLSVSVTPAELWPPDARMVEIVPTIRVTDDKDPSPVVKLGRIETREDIDSLPDNNPDVRVENGRIYLKAQRYGQNEGRTYTIHWSATDRADNRTTATATVRVPHDRGN